MTALLEKPVTQSPKVDEPLAHLISCPEDKVSAQAWLLEARVTGQSVIALCGYVWVPNLTDPRPDNTCEPCLTEAHGRIARGE